MLRKKSWCNKGVRKGSLGEAEGKVSSTYSALLLKIPTPTPVSAQLLSLSKSNDIYVTTQLPSEPFFFKLTLRKSMWKFQEGAGTLLFYAGGTDRHLTGSNTSVDKLLIQAGGSTQCGWCWIWSACTAAEEVTALIQNLSIICSVLRTHMCDTFPQINHFANVLKDFKISSPALLIKSNLYACV